MEKQFSSLILTHLFAKTKKTLVSFPLFLIIFLTSLTLTHNCQATESSAILETPASLYTIKFIQQPAEKTLKPLDVLSKSPINSISLTKLLLARSISDVLLHSPGEYDQIKETSNLFYLLHCSYFYLRLNVLQSQSHPPTI